MRDKVMYVCSVCQSAKYSMAMSTHNLSGDIERICIQCNDLGWHFDHNGYPDQRHTQPAPPAPAPAPACPVCGVDQVVDANYYLHCPSCDWTPDYAKEPPDVPPQLIGVLIDGERRQMRKEAAPAKDEKAEATFKAMGWGIKAEDVQRRIDELAPADDRLAAIPPNVMDQLNAWAERNPDVFHTLDYVKDLLDRVKALEAERDNLLITVEQLRESKAAGRDLAEIIMNSESARAGTEAWLRNWRERNDLETERDALRQQVDQLQNDLSISNETIADMCKGERAQYYTDQATDMIFKEQQAELGALRQQMDAAREALRPNNPWITADLDEKGGALHMFQQDIQNALAALGQEGK